MTSVTLSVSDEFKEELRHFIWINWSEIARQETMKKVMFEKYIQTGKISNEDWKFCEKIDWHPVDELPLKEKFRKELEKRKKEKSIKLKSVDEIFK